MKRPTQWLVKARLVAEAVVPAYGLWRELAPQAPLRDFLRCLRPSAADMADPAFVALQAKVALFTAVWGLKPILQHDGLGRALAGPACRGTAEFGIVSENFYLGLAVQNGRITRFRGRAPGRPDATVHFRDIPTASSAMHNQLDTLAATGTGDILVRGSVPLASNLGLAMQRISEYFPSTLFT